jgi:hypothetical protein
MHSAERRAIFVMVMLCLGSCGKQDGNRKETTGLTGQVLVDGAPVENLLIGCHDLNGLDKQNPTLSSASTDKEGKFRISTYKDGDGVPEGDYVLTFAWQEMNFMTMRPAGPDKLNDRYRDPANSKIKISVKKGKPADLGRIELTTK